MDLQLIYFAWCKEKIGRSQEFLSVPLSVETVSDLMTWLAERGAGYADVFASPDMIRSAVNHEHVNAQWALNTGDEVAFFPPVTGG